MFIYKGRTEHKLRFYRGKTGPFSRPNSPVKKVASWLLLRAQGDITIAAARKIQVCLITAALRAIACAKDLWALCIHSFRGDITPEFGV